MKSIMPYLEISRGTSCELLHEQAGSGYSSGLLFPVGSIVTFCFLDTGESQKDQNI